MILHTGAQNDKLRFFGRTLHDKGRNAVFFNWTMSGFHVAFTGTTLTARFIAIPDRIPGGEDDLPWLAVFTDDETEPTRMGLTPGEQECTLFSGENDFHTVRVVKLSEAVRGRAGLVSVETDGVFETPEAASRPYKLEFIGDSITCGFGVETDERGDIFDTALENSLLSYGTVAADLLGADCQFLCVSGIPLCHSANPDFKLILPGGIEVPQMAMEDYYAYTDLHHQRASGVSEYELWDHARFVPDAIVINLGTNDAFRCKVSGNDPAEQSHFADRYLAFLHTLRRANGNTPILACTLGSMDYFLYDDILRAVERYRSETGDERVFCLKYGGMYIPEEGSGALGHPSKKTHRRMGEELAKALRKWLPPTGNLP